MTKPVTPAMEPLNYVVWDRETFPSRTRGKAVCPYVTITPRVGRISFNPPAAKALGLTPDMGVEFIQAGKNMDEWYVALSNRTGAIRVSQKRDCSAFSNIRLAQAIADSLKRTLGQPSFRVQLATKPTQFADHRGGGVISAYALITFNLVELMDKKGGHR